MQVEFFAELHEGTDRLEIPWASPDELRNRYFGLKARPDLLDEVIEARDNPALKQFLATVNAADTVFATAKCQTWTTQEFSPAERSSFPTASIKFAAYIDLVFSHALLNFHREHFEQLSRRLQQTLNPTPVPARAELCLRQCYFHAQQAWGFYLTIFLYGYGATDVEAQRNWTAALQALGDSLTRLSALLRQALQQAGAPPAQT